MRNEIIKKATLVIVICLPMVIVSARSFATSTLDCSTKDNLLRIHVNSNDEIADISLYIRESEAYHFSPADFEKTELKWPRSEPPFHSNRLVLTRGKQKPTFPALKVEVNGETGTLQFKEGGYELICDWRR